MKQLLCGCDRSGTPKRSLACNSHWQQLPESLRDQVRPSRIADKKNDKQSLRAEPMPEWIKQAKRYWSKQERVAA